MGHVFDSRIDPSAERVDPPPPGATARSGTRRGDRTAESLLPDPSVWNALLGEPALSAGELAALNGMARPRFVPAAGWIFSQQEPARSLVFVRDGDAALGWRNANGQFHVERPVHGPGWLDQSSAWIEARHAIDARAVTPLVVVELPRDDVQALLVAQPALARRLIASLAREVHSLALSTHGLMHKDAPARFAHWLVERCQPGADAPQRATLRLSERKRDIASQLAITPETLSRLMRSLTRQGLISVAGYTVTVMDMDGLRRVAQS